jgi:uncharacterized protein
MKKTLFTSLLVVLAVGSTLAQQFKVLLFTKTETFHHESIHDGVTAMRNLAARHNFSLDWQENTNVFTDKGLEKYQAIVFLSTTGNILNAEQQGAMERFIKAGKGFVGIHAASDTEYEWPWYTQMVGMMFKIHPSVQTAYLKVENSNFPGMERFPKKLLWTDEWYEFGELKAKDLTYLVSVDEKTYDPKVQWGSTKGEGMGFHPISWYHPYAGGRAFYTALGHMGAIYTDQTFLDHVYGGIYWAATGKGL